MGRMSPPRLRMSRNQCRQSEMQVKKIGNATRSGGKRARAANQSYCTSRRAGLTQDINRPWAQRRESSEFNLVKRITISQATNIRIPIFYRYGCAGCASAGISHRRSRRGNPAHCHGHPPQEIGGPVDKDHDGSRPFSSTTRRCLRTSGESKRHIAQSREIGPVSQKRPVGSHRFRVTN